MARAHRAFPYLGVYLAWLGITLVLLAVAPDFVAAFYSDGEQTSYLVLGAGGFTLLVIGAAMIARRVRAPKIDPTLKSAQAAFSESPRAHAREEPDIVSAKPHAKPRLDPEVRVLDSELKEVNARINRAMVMLGTGKLSNEGYSAYVDELKQRRAELESRKVSILHARAFAE